MLKVETLIFLPQARPFFFSRMHNTARISLWPWKRPARWSCMVVFAVNCVRFLSPLACHLWVSVVACGGDGCGNFSAAILVHSPSKSSQNLGWPCLVFAASTGVRLSRDPRAAWSEVLCAWVESAGGGVPGVRPSWDRSVCVGVCRSAAWYFVFLSSQKRNK